ncbi:MAG: hypothetical protein ACI88H_003230 [Cocleimonas sp.]|jgi:hypothetical protein
MFNSLGVMASKNIHEALGEFAWKKRQLIVFTPSIENKQYQLFNKSLIEFNQDFNERNIQSWHVIADDKVLLKDISREELKANNFRTTYSVNNEEFRLILIGLDGGEKFRQQIVNLDEIFAEIDQMPMRIRELQSK